METRWCKDSVSPNAGIRNPEFPVPGTYPSLAGRWTIEPWIWDGGENEKRNFAWICIRVLARGLFCRGAGGTDAGDAVRFTTSATCVGWKDSGHSQSGPTRKHGRGAGARNTHCAQCDGAYLDRVSGKISQPYQDRCHSRARAVAFGCSPSMKKATPSRSGFRSMELQPSCSSTVWHSRQGPTQNSRRIFWRRPFLLRRTAPYRQAPFPRKRRSTALQTEYRPSRWCAPMLQNGESMQKKSCSSAFPPAA